MMGRALLIVGWISTLGLVSTGVAGYMLSIDNESIELHLSLGLASALLLLFSHCWIMFYLIGTGKAIKEAVAEYDLDTDLIERTKEFKNRSYGWLMLAMGLVMTVFIIGGGVYTRFIPAWVHHGLFYLAVLTQLRTLVIERAVLVENHQLMTSIDRRIASRAGSSGTGEV